MHNLQYSAGMAVLCFAALTCHAAEPTPTEISAKLVARITSSAGDSVAYRNTVATAVQGHPRVLEAIANQREQGQRVREVRAGLLPTINADLNTNRSLSRRFFDLQGRRVESLQPKATTDVSLQGQQLLTDFGATRHRIKGQALRTVAAQSDVADAATNVALEAASAWSAVVELQTLTQLGDAFIKRHEKILADTKLSFDQGFGRGSDVARVEAYLARAEGTVANLTRDLAQAKARYRSVFNTAAPDNLERVGLPKTMAATADEAVSLAQAQGASVVRAKALTSGAKEDYKAARSDLYPRLAVGVDATKYGIFHGGNDYDIRTRLISNYPLFDGGSRSSKSAQAYQRYRAAEDSESRAAQETARDTIIAFEDVTALQAQVDTLKRAYVASVRSRDYFIEQFKVARGTLLDVLQAEQDAFEATVAYIRAIGQLDLARQTLMARTGELLPSYGVSFSFSDKTDLWGVK